MKKRFLRKQLWKTIFLIFGIPLITWNCDDDTAESGLNNTALKTVTKQEVVELLSRKNRQNLNHKNGNSYVDYDLDNLTYEDITNTEAKLAVIPGETKNKAAYSRVLMLNVQGVNKAVVFTMFPSAKNRKTALFEGEITITTLEGILLKAFKVQEGKIINSYSSNSYTRKNSLSSKDTENSECRQWCGHQASDPNCICNMQYLDEVVVSGSTSIDYISISDLYGTDALNTSGCEVECDNIWNAVHAGSTIDSSICPNGYVKDKNGNCVEKPCEGDPIVGLEIAPQKSKSGIKGALFGCIRYGGICTTGKDGRNKQHNGIDLKNSYGSPIYAMYDGFIYSSKYDEDGAGYYTRIQSAVNGQTIITEYYHLQEGNRILQNNPGEPLVYVKAGDIIGYQGTSGNLEEAIKKGIVDSHTHIEVRMHNGSSRWGYKNFTPVNPTLYLSTSIDSNGTTTKSNCN